MPSSFNGNITDLNDAILALINASVTSAVNSANSELTAAENRLATLKGRVTELETGDPTPTPTPTPIPTSELIQLILTRHNEYRAARGIAPLTYSPAISEVSQDWADYMWSTQNMVHNPDYATQMPSGSTASAENIAWTSYAGTQAAEFMMQMWIDSAVHEASIRNANYNYVGIGVKQQDGRTYAAVNFGKYVTSPDSPSTPTPPTGDFTGGSGGSKTDQTNVTWSNGSLSSKYHIYAGGLDWNKKVGILIYGDGSGEYGLKNPTQSYLMGGTNGLIAVAKKHNMILLTPMAPGDGCQDGDGVCWYDTSNNGVTPAQKLKWSFDLINKVYKEYNIDKSRVAVGGYSSGAQWTSQFLIPAHGSSIMTDGVFVPISYGGAPRVTTTFTTAFKNAVVGSWDCGTADSAYSTASYGAIGGYNWYTSNGFTTDKLWVSGVGHDRSGQFGAIMDREITQHVKTA